MSPTSERRTVYYRGQVQGVGFRYTAQRTARGHAVFGFVRNLANGQVELVVEGSVTALDAFLGDVARKMAGYIEDADVATGAATGEFDAFEIRY